LKISLYHAKIAPKGVLSMKQQTFQGSRWEKQHRIRIIEDGGMKRLLLNSRPYMTWSLKDDLSPRLAIVQLYGLGMGTQEELAKVFGTNEKSVYNYIQAFSVNGAYALVPHKSGPKSSWKLNARVRSKILFIVLGQGIHDYEEIRRRLEAWGERVSTSSIREVLIESEIHGGMSVPGTDRDQGNLFNGKDHGQLYFTFSESAVSGGINSTEQRRSIEGRMRQEGGGKKTPEEKSGDRSYYSQSQRTYLNQLERGEYSAYAGGLLFAPFLEHYAYLPTLKRVIGTGKYEGYRLEELCLTLLYFDVFGFRSMEDFKRVYAEEFGVLIGRVCSPSHFTMRRFLHRIRELGKSEELIEEFAYEYLKGGIVRWGVMYIDGHFLPYSGMCPISKGWHGVRRMPMKGSYHFVGTDEDFTPWVFLIRSSEEDLLEKIPEIIEKAKAIGKRVGLTDQQIDNMIVVFDREGYSGELYRYFDGRDRDDGKRRAFFVSWSKYSKWVYDIPEDEFDKAVTVRYSIQKNKEFKYRCTERMMSKYGKIRAIVVQREKDRKRAAIYTNGTEEDLGTEKVVQLICRRWGEENLIKSLMGRHFINYSPGYVKERLEEQPMVDNPTVIELKKRKAGLASELHRLKVAFTDRIFKEATDDRNWGEIKKNETPLIADMVKLQNDIFFIDEEINKVPSKVPFDHAHDGERLLRLNYEKKRFLDCIKVFSYNMQKKMCELLLRYYGPEKEILPALSMIVNRGGYIKLEGQKLKVRLRRFRNQTIDYAARHLCAELNMLSPRTLDRFHYEIHYEVP